MPSQTRMEPTAAEKKRGFGRQRPPRRPLPAGKLSPKIDTGRAAGARRRPERGAGDFWPAERLTNRPNCDKLSTIKDDRGAKTISRPRRGAQNAGDAGGKGASPKWRAILRGALLGGGRTSRRLSRCVERYRSFPSQPVSFFLCDVRFGWGRQHRDGERPWPCAAVVFWSSRRRRAPA